MAISTYSDKEGRRLAGCAWLTRLGFVLLLSFASIVPSAWGAEHVTLSNGFEFDCSRQEPVGDKVRFYLQTSKHAASADGLEENYLEVAANSVGRVEFIPGSPSSSPVSVIAGAQLSSKNLQPTVAELHEMLARAGAGHRIDTDLLASVVHAESGGQLRAVSRTGARGLMQLMPGTASALGVKDAFIAEQNVEGGTKYLDQLLTRYHDNIALTLAAYNAGPGAVDRYKGVPPFRETRLYVARVIREFNRRKLTLVAER